MKKIIALGVIAGLMAVVTPVSAQPDVFATTVVRSVRAPHVTVPSHAVELAPGVFSLGTEVDSSGRVVEGIAFVHYKKEYGHKPQHNPGNGGDSTSTCYAFLANGAKWKNVESYVLDEINNAGYGSTTTEVADDIAASLFAWNDAVTGTIFGTRDTSNTTDRVVALDDLNEIFFGTLDDAGVIAVTYVWGIWWGKPSERKIVEYDMIFNNSFTWGNVGVTDETGNYNTDVMDLLNIAVHEVGHAAGLGHPSDSCTEESMYRFGASGETKKRTLNVGDITGIVKLYN